MITMYTHLAYAGHAAPATADRQLKQIRLILASFMIALFLSGLTAIPIGPELTALLRAVPRDTQLHAWLLKVLNAYAQTREQFPFLLYGYDWLAFAHFVLSILFIGPYRNPVRNIWVVEFGLIACALVLPAAFISGHFRGIPPGWQLIDCSFGVVGFALLWACYRRIRILQELNPSYT
jgi:hypothetical protein